MTPHENNPPATCPACGCTDAAGAHAHAIAAALIDDDLDRAMTLGLLEPVACSACTDDCSKRLRQAREARTRALAARERHRTRQARLERRAAERRSEEHTSELQSLMRISSAVFCLKKTIYHNIDNNEDRPPSPKCQTRITTNK